MPSRYDLAIDTDLESGMFQGSVDIEVTIAVPVSEVVVNAVDLELSNGSVIPRDGRAVEVAEVRLDRDRARTPDALGLVDPR
ncbi:MAG: hypothetical protein U0V56_05345 [Actinomycetota bacterium]